MMNNMKKRILIGIMVLSVVLSYMPTNTWAFDMETPTEDIVSEETDELADSVYEDTLNEEADGEKIDNVEINTDDVEANADDVEANADDVEANAVDVEANTDDAEVNADDVEVNAVDTEVNVDDTEVSGNSEEINDDVGETTDNEERKTQMGELGNRKGATTDCVLSWYDEDGTVLTGTNYPSTTTKGRKLSTYPIPDSKGNRIFCGWKWKKKEETSFGDYFWRKTEIVNNDMDFMAVYVEKLSGEGTEENPYLINSAADLKKLSYLVENPVYNAVTYHYRLTSDLDLSEVCGPDKGSWIPIGGVNVSCFQGVFDGNSHTISNLYIKESEIPYTIYFGLFSVASYSEIKNLTLDNAIVIADKGYTIGGILSAYSRTTKVANVTIKGQIEGGKHFSAISSDCRTTSANCQNVDISDVQILPYGYTVNQNIAYKIMGNGKCDVKGFYNESWIMTTYQEGGFTACQYGLQGATVSCEIKPTGNSNYVQIEYKVKAGNNPITAGKLAVFADTQIADNDTATISIIKGDDGKCIGYYMKDTHTADSCCSKNAQFALYFDGLEGLNAPSAYWFGNLQQAFSHWYTQITNDPATFGANQQSRYTFEGDKPVSYADADSAISFSWHNISLLPGEEMKFSFYLGAGDIDISTPPVIEEHTHQFSDEWSKDENYHWKECIKEGCTITSNSEKGSYGQHDYDEGTELSKAGCTSKGEMQFTCKDCGYQKTEEIAALGHDFDTTVWLHNEQKHWHACKRENCYVTNGDENHYGGTATFTERAKCIICGEPYGELLKDTKAPEMTIDVSGDSFKSFINSITFGYFYKETQKVTISADDIAAAGELASGVDKIYYYISKFELDEPFLHQFTDWEEYTEPFYISPNNHYIIYAKGTDHAGNIIYIGTDGLVLDDIAPKVEGVTNGASYCEAVKVYLEDEFLKQVMVNNSTVVLDDDNSFWLYPSENLQTVKVVDLAGNVTEKTVMVHDGHDYAFVQEQNQLKGICQHDASHVIYLNGELQNQTEQNVETDANQLKDYAKDTLNPVQTQVGDRIKVVLDVKNKTSIRPEQDILEQKLYDMQSERIGAYFDINLYRRKISKSGELIEEKQIKNLTTDDGAKTIDITIEIPREIQNGSDYQIIRVHEEDGTKEVEVLPTVKNGDSLTFSSGKFSIFAIAYTPAKQSGAVWVPTSSEPEPEKVPEKAEEQEIEIEEPEEEIDIEDTPEEGVVGNLPKQTEEKTNKKDNEPKTGGKGIQWGYFGLVAGILYLLECFLEKRENSDVR